jgi:general secretion pathway protein G
MHRTRRAIERAFSLVEVLIVIAIIALLATGVSVAAFEAWIRAQIKATTDGATQIRGAVTRWWMDNDATACPNFDQLLGERLLDKQSKNHDAWGTPWRIVCADHDVEVISSGPDKQAGTDDDIRVP